MVVVNRDQKWILWDHSDDRNPKWRGWWSVFFANREYMGYCTSWYIFTHTMMTEFLRNPALIPRFCIIRHSQWIIEKSDRQLRYSNVCRVEFGTVLATCKDLMKLWRIGSEWPILCVTERMTVVPKWDEWPIITLETLTYLLTRESVKLCIYVMSEWRTVSPAFALSILNTYACAWSFSTHRTLLLELELFAELLLSDDAWLGTYELSEC